MECGLEVGYDICETQEKIFSLAMDMGFDDENFISKYMNSQFCNREMDALYSWFQMADPEDSMDYILKEIEPQKNYRHHDEYAIQWTGWMYRYLHLRLKVSSREIYAILPLKDMLVYYIGMHTQDDEYFVDVIKEKFER